MADTKITALAAITTVDPAADVLPIVDISDTSMAASGTTKKITSNQILGAGGTATLASATITGAATVGTTLGVTGASTLASASVTGALGAAGLNVTGATIPANGVYLGSANSLSFSAASTLGMTLDSTGLGIGGTAIGTKLEVVTSTSGSLGGTATVTNSAASAIGNAASFNFRTNANFLLAGYFGARIEAVTPLASNNTDLVFYNYKSVTASGDETMRITSSGNVGIGVSTFGTSAAKVLSIGTGTEPTTGPAGSVQFFTSTRSASNTIPAIFTEGSGVTNAAITNTTVTNKIAIKINGTIYYLLATTSAA